MKKNETLFFDVAVEAESGGMTMKKTVNMTFTEPSEAGGIDRLNNFFAGTQDVAAGAAAVAAKDLLHAMFLEMQGKMVKEQMEGKEPGESRGVQ